MKGLPTKVLWHSNSPWSATGYGVQSGHVLRRLKAAGIDVGASCFYGLNGGILDWHGIRCYPGGSDAYGSDVLVSHAITHFGDTVPVDGVTIGLGDAWVFQPGAWSKVSGGMWTPVDHDPAPPKVVENLQASGITPIAMSRFGERKLREAGFDGVLYAPHGVDTDVYRPMDRDEARDLLGWPKDRFMVGMVAANKGQPPRKGWPEAAMAFAAFLKDHDDAVLYIHTEPTGVLQGTNLPLLFTQAGVPPESVIVANQYEAMLVGSPPEKMRAVFSAFDVLLNPAYGEGFGVPIIEAQACGTPVIATDCTAMSELNEVGWRIGGQRQWSAQGSFWVTPDVDRIVSALTDAYRMGTEKLAKRARAFAEGYDNDLIFERHWLPILRKLERQRQLRADESSVESSAAARPKPKLIVPGDDDYPDVKPDALKGAS